jgi:hypothetical protein
VPISAEFAGAAADCVAEIRRLAVLPADLDEGSGAPFFRDMAAIRRLPQPAQDVRSRLIGLGMSGATVSWASADDHLRALEADLRRQPAPVWSMMTLARAIQESAVFVCYVAEPEIGVHERLTRIAATWLQDVDYLTKAAPEWHPGRQSARQDRQFRIDELVRAGFILNSATAPTTVSLDGASTPVNLNVTARAKLLMPPDAPEPYRLASGAVHARPWFLSGNAIEQDGEWSTSWATVVSAVVIAAHSARGGVQSLCSYLGLDDDQARCGEIDATLRTLLETPAN